MERATKDLSNALFRGVVAFLVAELCADMWKNSPTYTGPGAALTDPARRTRRVTSYRWCTAPGPGTGAAADSTWPCPPSDGASRGDGDCNTVHSSRSTAQLQHSCTIVTAQL